MRTFEDYYEWHLQKRCLCNQWNQPCEWCDTGSWNDYEEWCLDEDLKPLTEKEYKESLEMKLNRKNFAEFFRTDYYTITTKFLQSELAALGNSAAPKREIKEYTYKVPKSVELQLGDKLLVCVSNDIERAEKLDVVFVTAINHEAEIEEDSPFAYKWIVGKFDDVMTSYRENLVKDQNLKRGVHKLEQALERVSLRNQLKMAMLELDDETKKELGAIFGMKNLSLENGSGGKEEEKS